jgi:hypothetical protein
MDFTPALHCLASLPITSSTLAATTVRLAVMPYPLAVLTRFDGRSTHNRFVRYPRSALTSTERPSVRPSVRLSTSPGPDTPAVTGPVGLRSPRLEIGALLLLPEWHRGKAGLHAATAAADGILNI